MFHICSYQPNKGTAMPKPHSEQFQDAVESLLFSHYMRTGERLYGQAAVQFVEQKFNPNHNPDDGRFTFGPGGGSLAPRGMAGGRLGMAGMAVLRDFPPPSTHGTANMARMRSLLFPPKPADRPKPVSSPRLTSKSSADPIAAGQRDIGAIAAKFEGRKLEGPGTISSGRHDPGGVSYGTFQMSSAKAVVRTFVASPEASVWAAQFYGKSPATRPFDDQWRAIAAHDPAGFESAQRAFIVRTNYSPGSQLLRRMAGFDLENANSAIRQAFFATAVQHGPTGGGALFARSVQTVDRRLKRTDRGYESALINTLYDNRTEQRRHFAQGARMRAAAFAKKHDSGNVANWNGKAQQADNDVIHRYPRERFDALLLLSVSQCQDGELVMRLIFTLLLIAWICASGAAIAGQPRSQSLMRQSEISRRVFYRCMAKASYFGLDQNRCAGYELERQGDLSELAYKSARTRANLQSRRRLEAVQRVWHEAINLRCNIEELFKQPFLGTDEINEYRDCLAMEHFHRIATLERQYRRPHGHVRPAH
jgi:hypothetical protein